MHLLSIDVYVYKTRVCNDIFNSIPLIGIAMPSLLNAFNLVNVSETAVLNLISKGIDKEIMTKLTMTFPLVLLLVFSMHSPKSVIFELSGP